MASFHIDVITNVSVRINIEKLQPTSGLEENLDSYRTNHIVEARE